MGCGGKPVEMSNAINTIVRNIKEIKKNKLKIDYKSSIKAGLLKSWPWGHFTLHMKSRVTVD